jgi:superfamily I DNA/RNA helicase/RecB family exonuclease
MNDDLRIGPEDWEAAVASVEGPQLVVAGPGTGKTEFLVRRASHLIDRRLAAPDHVLVLTFSRRAAADLRRRIGDRLGRSTTSIAASTFHSFAHRLLEGHGGGSVATLLTGPEHVALVAELLADEAPHRWPLTLRDLLGSPTLAADVADFLLRCSERLIDPDELERRAAERPEWHALPAFAARYRRELAARGRIDYGGLLEQAVALLEQPERAADLAGQYPYVLADEYQDTSPAQAALLDLATRPHRNLTVAADPYQSVYSFRGADLSNVAAFPERFRHLDGRPARRIVLTTSFRVPAEILEAALRVTTPGELPGSAGPVVPAAHAGSVEAHVFDQASAEAEWIAAEVERLNLVDRLPFRSMAVLVRSKRHLLPELSRALHRRRIPHDTPDSRLVDHAAVQLVFDLARAAAGADDEDRERAVRRVLLGPLFTFPVGAERDLLRRQRRSGSGWPALLRREAPDAVDLAGLLEEPGWATDLPAIEGFWHAWERLPQFERLVHDPACGEHRAAWSSFAQALERQAERDRRVSLLDYWRMTADEDFEATPLLSYARRAEDRLTLTTLHQAKGLEYEVVVIADAAEGTFPDLRRGMSLLQPHLLGAADPAGLPRFRLQEEMRLAYTAMTRARRRVVWTATSAGIDEGERRPSRFLLAAAGARERSEVGPPRPRSRPPVTAAEAEAGLRRRLADPAAAAAERLAAAAVLAHPPVPLWRAERFAGIRRRGPDRGVLGERFSLSPSQAEAYDTCPRRYVFERRLGIGDTSSPYAAFGSLVHLVLERAESAALHAGADRAGVEGALAALDGVWEGADFGSPSLNRAWKRKAADLLVRLYGDWPADSAGPVETEYPLTLELDGVEWRGRADRIERTTRGTLRIVDYKTSTDIPSASEAAASLQLAYYLAAARADPHLAEHGEVAEAELWYPRADRRDWRRRFEGANLAGATARLIELGRGIAREDWTPSVSRECGRCRLRPLCPLWPEGREAYS